MINPAMLQMVLQANQGSPFGQIPDMIMNDGPRVARTDMPGLDQAANAIGRMRPGGGGGGGGGRQDWLNKAQNTPLSGGEELMFQSWVRNTPWFQEQTARTGQEPDLDNASYDYRGAWKAGVEPKKTAAGQWDWAAVNPTTGARLRHFDPSDPTAGNDNGNEMSGGQQPAPFSIGGAHPPPWSGAVHRSPGPPPESPGVPSRAGASNPPPNPEPSPYQRTRQYLLDVWQGKRRPPPADFGRVADELREIGSIWTRQPGSGQPEKVSPVGKAHPPAPSAGGSGSIDAIADDVMRMFGQPPAPQGVDQGAHAQLQAGLGREASAPPPFAARVSGVGGMPPTPPAIDVPFAPGNGPGGVPPQFAQNMPPSRVPPGATQPPNMFGVGPGTPPPPWATPPINPNGQPPQGAPPPGANMQQDRSRMLRDFGLAMMANSGVKPFGQDNSLIGNIGRSGQQTMGQADAREKEGYTRSAGSEAAKMKDRHHRDEIAVKREGNKATADLRLATIQATEAARKTQNDIRMLQVQMQRQGNTLKEGELRVRIEDGRRRAVEAINKDPMMMADPKAKQKELDKVNRIFDDMGSQYGVQPQGGNTTSPAPQSGAAAPPKNGGAPAPAAGKRITKDGKAYEFDGRGWKVVR